MKKSTNLFCIVGKTGSGKSLYIESLFKDKGFINKYNISNLVYGTTRSKRENEIEGKDYHFITKDEFDKINYDDLIESRSYYTLNDGEVYYFTKKEYLEDSKNIICIASPYQYEKYKSWFYYKSLKNNTNYNIYVILIDVDIKTRLNRVINNRSSKDDDIYELCRRVIQEKMEFDDVCNRLPELSTTNSSEYNNTCYIDNSSNSKDNIFYNINKIKNFIVKFNCEN